MDHMELHISFTECLFSIFVYFKIVQSWCAIEQWLKSLLKIHYTGLYTTRFIGNCCSTWWASSLNIHYSGFAWVCREFFFYIRLGLPQDWPHKQIVRSWVVQIHVVNCCIWNHRALGLKTHARQELRLLESEVPMTLSRSLCCFRFHDLSSKNRLPCDHLASCTMNKLLSMANTVRDCLM